MFYFHIVLETMHAITFTKNMARSHQGYTGECMVDKNIKSRTHLFHLIMQHAYIASVLCNLRHANRGIRIQHEQNLCLKKRVLSYRILIRYLRSDIKQLQTNTQCKHIV